MVGLIQKCFIKPFVKRENSKEEEIQVGQGLLLKIAELGYNQDDTEYIIQSLAPMLNMLESNTGLTFNKWENIPNTKIQLKVYRSKLTGDWISETRIQDNEKSRIEFLGVKITF